MSDRTLARIGALLRKAESTDNDHEADAFLQAAQRLATLASVDLAVARAHTAERERRAAPTQREVLIGESGRRGLRTYVELYLAIARANDLRCDIARNSTRVFAYGFDTDLDTVEALYGSLVIQMVRASDEYVKSGRYAEELVEKWSPSRRQWEAKPVHAVTARVNFQRAFALRIGRRLATTKAAVTAAVDVERPTVGVALALRDKEIEIRDHYRARSRARGHWEGSWTSGTYSASATRAGDRAGRAARLGGEPAIGGSRASIGR
jgi:hypothetical protein